MHKTKTIMIVGCSSVVFISSCGVQGTRHSKRNDGSLSADASSVDPGYRACKMPEKSDQSTSPSGGLDKPQASLMNLQGATYSANLYPILQSACSECHKPSIENRQNSTNCYYIRDHFDSFLKRIKNARDAQAFKVANPTASNDAINNRYPRTERPMPPIDKPPLSEAEVALFESWRGIQNPCGETDQINQEEVIPKPKTHSSDREESNVQNLNKLFATASCEDGPDINSEDNWKLFEPTLRLESAGTGGDKYYDFFKGKYLDHVTLVKESCSMEGLLTVFADLPSVRDALASHAAYGWRVIQCGGEKGNLGEVFPHITIGSLSRVTTSIGDYVYGLNLKYLSVTSEEEKGK